MLNTGPAGKGHSDKKKGHSFCIEGAQECVLGGDGRVNTAVTAVTAAIDVKEVVEEGRRRLSCLVYCAKGLCEEKG
jgi:hypothetical protein